MTQKNNLSPRSFEDFHYERPNLATVTESFEKHLASFGKAASAEAQSLSLQHLNAIREEFGAMYNLCLVRHTSNTEDPVFEAENQYFDEATPDFEALNHRFYEAILQSSFRSQLEEILGSQLFTLAQMALKTFNPSILSNLQEENALSTAYTKIKAQAKIEFNGETYNLSRLAPLEVASDRDLRQKASEAKWTFYASHVDSTEHIFDKMVKTRHEIAQKLGFNNFVEVGYARMRRLWSN